VQKLTPPLFEPDVVLGRGATLDAAATSEPIKSLAGEVVGRARRVVQQPRQQFGRCLAPVQWSDKRLDGAVPAIERPGVAPALERMGAG